MERHDISAAKADDDAWEHLPYRDSLWLEDGGAVGDVSANRDFYHVFQYGDILESVALALDTYDDTLTPTGHVLLSESGHTMSAYIDFAGVAAEPAPGDVIDLGLKVRSGHTGYHGLKYDVGAERQVCTNGMLAFISDFHLDQSHSDPFDYGLAQTAVSAIVEGVDVVEDRLEQATDRTFLSEDEALLVLLDYGLDAYFENSVTTLRNSLQAELDSAHDQPTLYDTYNAATRAITHTAELAMWQREAALEQAACLLDTGGTLPEPTELGQQALERRTEAYTTDDSVEPYWADEEETLHSLLQTHSDSVGS